MAVMMVLKVLNLAVLKVALMVDDLVAMLVEYLGLMKVEDSVLSMVVELVGLLADDSVV